MMIALLTRYLQCLQHVCKGVQKFKTGPMAIPVGSKRTCSSDTYFLKKSLICQFCKNDPLYKLAAARLDTCTFIPALNERKDDVRGRLYASIQTKDKLMYLKPVCHTVCKSIYTHERSG